MGHYTGPKARINRRLNALIFESNGAKKAFDRRESAPGSSPNTRSRNRTSAYGEALREKQKIKYYYGLSEKQLRRLYDRAGRMPGNTGENLLMLCERRIDNVVRLAGFTKTRPQARQGVSHGHFLLNGLRHDVASAMLRPGDRVNVKALPNVQTLYLSLLAENDSPLPTWIEVDAEHLMFRVNMLPTIADITLPVNVASVIELMSR